MFNLDSPKNIYQDLIKEVSKLVKSIADNESNVGSDTTKKDITYLKQELLKQKDKVENKLAELDGNAEWDHLTIAFFGETNAGKSTIVESLRIFFQENSKKVIQNKFNCFLEDNELGAEKLIIIKDEILKLDAEITALNTQVRDFEEVSERKEQELLSALEEVKLDGDRKISLKVSTQEQVILANELNITGLLHELEVKKAEATFFQKICMFFVKSKVEKSLILHRKKLEREKEIFSIEIDNLKQEVALNIENNQDLVANFIKNRNRERELFNQKLEEIREVSEVEKEKLAQKERLLEDLLEFEDGHIIGDGRSDYTQSNSEYLLDIKGVKIKLIDVPGIEGNEDSVSQEILKAVQKAHVVFYVTSKDASPNEGTLEKIKTHLSSQTEVWTIYNKPTISHRALKNITSQGEDERESLNSMNALMQKILGKNYRGDMTISGLAGFYSVATCLVPFNKRYNDQKKFLDHYDRNALFSRSLFDSFNNILQEQILDSAENKIKASNFNKANHVIKEVIESLTILGRELEILSKNVFNQYCHTKIDVLNELESIKSKLKTQTNSTIESFKNITRKDIYSEIEEDISNDEFKKILKYHIDNNSEKLKTDLQNVFTISLGDFSKRIEEKVERFTRRLDMLQEHSLSEAKGYDRSFEFKFDFKAGIKTWALLSTALAAGLAFWWNPVGWVAITLTAVTLVFSFVKSIWGFFSSDYKKSQQKNSTDSNLSSIVRQIHETNDKEMKSVEIKVEGIINDLIVNLERPSTIIKEFYNEIDKTINEFDLLSTAVTEKYEVL